MFPKTLFLTVFSVTFIRLLTALQQPGSHDNKVPLPSNTPQSLSYSNTSTSPVNIMVGSGFSVRCDGATYGYNPNILDCEDAKEYLDQDTKQWTFGERHTGLPEDSKYTSQDAILGRKWVQDTRCLTP